MAMVEIKEKAIQHLKQVAKKAGLNLASLTDDQIWSLWYEAYTEAQNTK